MRISTLSRARAASLALAVTMVGAGAIVFAPSSQAADTYTISPKTGPGGVAGQVMIVTGKKFENAAGVNQVGTVSFKPETTCGVLAAGTPTAVTTKSVLSPTKAVLTVPSLALGAANAPKTYQLCVYTSAAGNALMGSAKYTVYPVPTIANSGLSTTSGSALGGTEVGITGTFFTKTSKVTFDGVAAKTTFGDATSLSAVAPAHLAETVQVRVITEGGTSANNAAHDDFTYKQAVKVSPTGGTGADNSVISITGKGFSAYDLDAASALSASKTSVLLVPAGTVIADTTDLSGGLPTGAYACDNVQRESDTQLSCQVAGAMSSGGYTVALLTLDGAQLVVGTSSSGYSKSASYTAAPF